MSEEGPNKVEMQEIIGKLRNLPSNRICFDCNARNPTWASITYGIFICIDCSAVHRSLGVHVSFVRSTQLDTNWTWVQLRNMQLGGNSCASTFFTQHHCTTNDAQQKYNSRAAQLYREKLNQSVAKYNKLHGFKILLDSEGNETPTDKDADFFEEISSAQANFEELSIDSPARLQNKNTNEDDGIGPKVDLLTESSSNTASAPRKSTIGQRKMGNKPGAKKGGFGAQKVKTNFSDIEKEATLLEQMREKQEEETKLNLERKVEDDERQMATMRLAYQDLSKQQKIREEQLKKVDPNKAEQVERLGMGVGIRCGVSHSALSDMRTIDQTSPSHKQNRNKMPDSFFDEFEVVENSLGISSMIGGFSSKKSSDWEIIEPRSSPPKRSETLDDIISRPKREYGVVSSSSTDEAQKKFGNAKAISSDQFFTDSRDNDFERRANLSRFDGQKSISSADYFGDGRQRPQQNTFQASLQNVDLDDVKESVRNGVTKVAGKLSNLANGMMSSLQEKYGY